MTIKENGKTGLTQTDAEERTPSAHAHTVVLVADSNGFMRVYMYKYTDLCMCLCRLAGNLWHACHVTHA